MRMSMVPTIFCVRPLRRSSPRESPISSSIPSGFPCPTGNRIGASSPGRCVQRDSGCCGQPAVKAKLSHSCLWFSVLWTELNEVLLPYLHSQFFECDHQTWGEERYVRFFRTHLTARLFLACVSGQTSTFGGWRFLRVEP